MNRVDIKLQNISNLQSYARVDDSFSAITFHSWPNPVKTPVDFVKEIIWRVKVFLLFSDEQKNAAKITRFIQSTKDQLDVDRLNLLSLKLSELGLKEAAQSVQEALECKKKENLEALIKDAKLEGLYSLIREHNVWNNASIDHKLAPIVQELSERYSNSIRVNEFDVDHEEFEILEKINQIYPIKGFQELRSLFTENGAIEARYRCLFQEFAPETNQHCASRAKWHFFQIVSRARKDEDIVEIAKEYFKNLINKKREEGLNLLHNNPSKALELQKFKSAFVNSKESYKDFVEIDRLVDELYEICSG